jgi:hypothetical protein
MGLNVTTYSPGKTIDLVPTTARQLYESLDSIPDGAIVVGHTWGHPDLVIAYYSVSNGDRFDYINFDSLISNLPSSIDYEKYQESIGIVMPSRYLEVRGQIYKLLEDSTVQEFSLELQELNPGREVYVTYVKSSEIPMEFGLVPASEYSTWCNNLTLDKIQHVR